MAAESSSWTDCGRVKEGAAAPDTADSSIRRKRSVALVKDRGCDGVEGSSKGFGGASGVSGGSEESGSKLEEDPRVRYW